MRLMLDWVLLELAACEQGRGSMLPAQNRRGRNHEGMKAVVTREDYDMLCSACKEVMTFIWPVKNVACKIWVDLVKHATLLA